MTRPATSPALLDRLARRFEGTPGHAAWRARILGSADGCQHVTRYVLPQPDADPVPSRGGHTELALDRI